MAENNVFVIKKQEMYDSDKQAEQMKNFGRIVARIRSRSQPHHFPNGFRIDETTSSDIDIDDYTKFG